MRIAANRRSTVDVAVAIFMLLLANHFMLIRNTAYNLCVQSIKVKSLYDVRDYVAYETQHFSIKYTLEDRDIVSVVADTIEKDFKSVTQRLRHTFDRKVQIIIYPNLETMRRKLKLLPQDRPMGIYYGGILHILSPKIWIGDAGTEEIRREFAQQGPMIHELVHLIVDQKAHGNFPLWFTEGIALYYEYRFTGYEWRKDLSEQGSYYTLHELTHYFDSIDIDVAYRRSFEIIEQIVERHGEQKLLYLLDELGKGEIGMYGQITLESVINNLIQ